MPFTQNIQTALSTYDQQKGFLRRLFGDHPAIKALKNLSADDQINPFKINQCFTENLPYKAKASYQVYRTILTTFNHQPAFQGKDIAFCDIDHLLKELDQAKLATQKNVNRFVNTYNNFRVITFALNRLNRCQLLTQSNLDALNDHPEDIGIVVCALDTLRGNNLLTQKNFATILKIPSNAGNIATSLASLHQANLLTTHNQDRLLHPDHQFLCSNEAYSIIWHRIPSHLFTQTVFDQLITLVQQQNPEQQIAQYIDQLLVANPNAGAQRINDTQSTHHTSVHRSVSESAMRLNDRYGVMIAEKDLENTLQMAKDYVTSLSDNSEKNKAAKRCINRIIKHTFIDPSSKLTTRQLLALSFLAIHDAGNRLADLQAARKQFIEGLYEIQRGYNLSELGIDDGDKQDKPICAGGTFNKLIEKLQGIHTDANIIHLTPALATLKLPIVVNEIANEYLTHLANPQTTLGLYAFISLIKQIATDGIAVIWDKIKDKIADRLFDEFSGLYAAKNNRAFVALVDAGQYLELTDLNRFQKQLANSEGYREFSSSQIVQYAKFFSSAPSTTLALCADNKPTQKVNPVFLGLAGG